MDRALVRTSKALAKLLRHDPEGFGVALDEQGWARVDDVVAGMRAAGRRIDRTTIETVVAQNDKQRFELSADGSRIRARQGHSIAVDLGLDPIEPPEVLYHGTVARFLESIRADGLEPGGRQHVHLSATVETARLVGARRGKPIVLRVAAARMREGGHVFYLATNGVWLTDHVPPEFVEPLA